MTASSEFRDDERAAAVDVPKRKRELDSLRGLAALSVLMYHALALNSGQLAAGLGLRPVVSTWASALVYTPLHVAWLGAEAVLFFFVLSGFVLTKLASRPAFDFGAYVPGRLARLYLPVFAAVGLALLSFVFPHIPREGIDPGIATSYPVTSVLSDLTLLGGTSTSLGVLWSLQWEVLFSLLLPLYLVIGRKRPVLTTAGAAVLCLLGWAWNVPSLSYLPVFFFGVVLAQNWSRVEERFRFLRTKSVLSHLVAFLLLLAALCGLTSYFLVGHRVPSWLITPRVATLPLVVGSIVIVMILAQMWQPLKRILNVWPLRFLGDISFSLYLVHLPIVVTAIFVFGSGGVAAVSGVCVAIGLAVLFYFGVEKPTHRLSKRINQRMYAMRAERAQSAGRQ